MPLSDNYLNAIRGFEGYNPRPYWDYRQWTSGYGTRASGQDEEIDQPEADRRFRSELGRAGDSVRGLGVTMTPGQEAALTSLTYNAGPGWMGSGLGAAVRSGDWRAARERFLQYVNAGGRPVPGLQGRRAQEAAWFDEGSPAPLGAPQPPPQGAGMDVEGDLQRALTTAQAPSGPAPGPPVAAPPDAVSQADTPWWQSIGTGLAGAMSAFSPIGTAHAGTPGGAPKGSRENPYTLHDPPPAIGAPDGIFWDRGNGTVYERTGGRWQATPGGQPPQPPPPGADLAAGIDPAALQRLLRGDGAPQPETLAGAPSVTPQPGTPPVGPGAAQLPPVRRGPPDEALLGGPATGLMPRDPSRRFISEPIRPVPPFGAPTVTPAPPPEQSLSDPSTYQPMGHDLTRDIAGQLGPPQAPPPDADAIVRGAEQAAATRASQPRQPGFLERLGGDPLFQAGLAILGTAPGGNWGPAGVQALQGATRSRREQSEYERLQSRRTVMDRVWREAFGADGRPNMSHPLMQGLPPEMAGTIYAMGPEQGLPALQRWQMFRGQQAEQARMRQAQMQMVWGDGQPQPPPASGEAQAGAGFAGLRARAGLPSVDAPELPGLGTTPQPVPGIPGLTAAPTAPLPAPPTRPPAASGGGPMVRIGGMTMTIPEAQLRAVRLDAMGMRSEPLEAAIKAAAATAPQVGTTERISALLGELAGIPKRPEYSGAFSGAIGRFEGDPGGLFTNPFGAIGRAWSGDRGAEIRRTIEGTSAALAAAVKPLIRGSSEGPWSDIDQAKLDSIVGNLTLATNATSYARELANVRRRIAALMAERGLADLPPVTAPSSGWGQVRRE